MEGNWDGFCCFFPIPSLSFPRGTYALQPILTSPSLPPPCSWLTGGTTIGSGLTYLTGEGTGNLLLKKLKLKKGEVAAGTTGIKDDGDSEKKEEEKK